MKKSALTPTTRTLRALIARGWWADIAERQLGKLMRRDFLGIADIVAFYSYRNLGAGFDVLLVQATSHQHVAERVAKIRAHPNTPKLLADGVAIQVWGWWKDRDEPRIETITLEE